MNRIIKFRAWDKETNRMSDVFELIDLVSQAMNYTVGYFETLKLIQCTGLLDKNGKEIYEGDLLRDGDSEPCLHKIIWWGDQAKYELETWEGNDIWSSGLFSYLDDLVEDGKLTDFEIVGNIYENRQLFENLNPREQ